MSTTVSHKGSHRNVTDLPIENWNKHKDVIIAYCDGADVKGLPIGSSDPEDWKVLDSPQWQIDRQYEVIDDRPKPGTVWITEDGDPLVKTVSDDYVYGWYDLNTHQSGFVDDLEKDITPAAPSVEAYYAGLFYDKSLSKDSGFEYDDAVKLLKIITETMK